MIDPNPTFVALCCWREARGEDLFTKQAQVWSVRNRVENPKWWGKTWMQVIFKPLQYSSFNPADPNVAKFPSEGDPAWLDCLSAVNAIYTLDISMAPSLADPTGGAVSYYDKSLDDDPPSWAARMTHTVDVGNFHYFKEAI